MTETLGSAGSAGSAARGAAKQPLAGVAHREAADRLKAELQEYLAAQAQRMLVGAGRKLGEATVKLNDIAEGNSPGLGKLALDGGRKLADGKGPLRTALEVGAGHAKDSVVGAFKNLGGGKGKRKGGAGNKPTVIIEYVDVGVPLRTAYDQWTQYQDFSTFAKGVKSAKRADDTTSDWQLKVFWSNRSWKAHTTEQVPDDRIAWTSEGAKGTTKGVVSFHRLDDNLTRVLLVVEYYPQGLFEKTGNLWRAQGRRARLDLKNYVRFVTLKGEAEDGWRGEIRDGEVVRSHEDAVAEEDEEEEYDENEENEENGESDETGEYAEDAEPEDAYEEDEEDEDEEEPEDAYEEEDEYEDETEPEYAGGGSRR
ncbi:MULTISPECIES: SRPBCC family protein [unclassified Streptomyces]|uniref:SRPBCC family protein n=1 Tax=unclassified Streptomyces TaxID=2593676 RepID=UPI002364FE2A|nr:MULTISPECIES: SRPBCC family protein [unclassified Streptomyces]MDF3145631.1 SRPBCC family protein [Streptomyces sp. T21Q-yed]WDF42626.1 SRPBCC family protein [Streptomyces sp. T12]